MNYFSTLVNRNNILFLGRCFQLTVGHYVWYFSTEGPNLHAPIGNVLSLVSHPLPQPLACRSAPPHVLFILSPAYSWFAMTSSQINQYRQCNAL
jgi:hypothetical protein